MPSTQPLSASGPPAGSPPQDHAGKSRILQAATELFGERGSNGTSFKRIAERAGVAPTLIVHHYGSKHGLQSACDEYVVDTVRRIKTDVVAQGGAIDPLSPLWAFEQYAPVLRYLARRLGEDSAHVNELVDSMVDDAERYTGEAERMGLIRHSDDPRTLITVLTVWSLGALVMHHHLERLIGVDLLGGSGPPLDYLRAATEILGEGILTPNAYRMLRADISHTTTESENP